MTTASGRLVDYLGSGTAAARPVAPVLTTGSIGIYYATDTGATSVWDGSSWHSIGGGGSVAWGSITGSLSSQSDLNTALNSKMTNPMTTADDMIIGGSSGIPARLAVGSNGQVLTVVSGAPAWQTPATSTGSTYAARLCALLEPGAIEAIQTDTFSYAIGSTAKYCIASWQTQLATSGRSEVRDPSIPMPLQNVTVTGTGSGSVGIFIDPTIPTYTDPWSTYYNRKQIIDTSDVKTVAITGTGQHIPFLPGAYGAIIIQVTCFELAWIIWRIANTWGPNLANEISDSSTQRIGNALSLVINKAIAGEIESSSTGGSGASGSVSYILLPSTWSVIPDPLSGSYLFRDDFMGASLDTTTKWTRVQSSTNNVEINTNYQWCSLTGNSSWGSNGILCKTSFARTVGRVYLVDFFAGRNGGSTGLGIVGWSDGAGQAQSNFAHGVNFAGSGIINVYENNNNRGTVGSGWTNGGIYRIRITLTSTGATYEIQGGKEYPSLGGATWTNITPGTTSSSTTPLYPAASAWAQTSYISDVRIY